MAVKESKSLKEQKEIFKLKLDGDEQRHKWKMEQLEYARKSQKLAHEQELERGRIKSAEIRKSMERQELMRMGRR